MSEFVLDASALLAFLRDEPGGEIVESRLPESRISAVNLSEVQAKAAERGGSPQEVAAQVYRLGLPVEAFGAEDGLTSARLRPLTKSDGLSFGDRACLALGLRLNHAVLTAERSWENLDVGVRVELIR